MNAGEDLPPDLRRLARDEAEAVHHGLPSHIELGDVLGYAHVGLAEARARFDPSRGVPFDLYARHRVRGAIYDGLRSLGLLRRREYSELRRQVVAWEAAGEPTARPAETSASTEARALFRSISTIATALLADAALQEPPADPTEDLVYAADRERVRRAVAALPDEHREVLTAAYDLEDRGDSAAALARRRGVHRSSVTRWHQEALSRLRRVLVVEHP